MGRPHFLSRVAFKRRMQQRGLARKPGSVRSLGITPLLDLLVGLTFLLLPFWAIWRLTQWTCGPVTNVVGSAVRKVARALWRWVYRVAWRRPVERFGVAVTLWWWLLAAVLVGVISALVTGNWLELAGLLPLAVLIVSWWRLLRWWRARVYRPRPLPTRRRRHDDG